jgi:hypothetical protein
MRFFDTDHSFDPTTTSGVFALEMEEEESNSSAGRERDESGVNPQQTDRVSHSRTAPPRADA